MSIRIASRLTRLGLVIIAALGACGCQPEEAAPGSTSSGDGDLSAFTRGSLEERRRLLADASTSRKLDMYLARAKSRHPISNASDADLLAPYAAEIVSYIADRFRTEGFDYVDTELSMKLLLDLSWKGAKEEIVSSGALDAAREVTGRLESQDGGSLLRITFDLLEENCYRP